MEKKQKRVYKIVLTGGPCGGKTTGQSRLCTFFENLGWKVFRVPETATVLLSGGIKFSDLSAEEVPHTESTYTHFILLGEIMVKIGLLDYLAHRLMIGARAHFSHRVAGLLLL
ncbi:hypothetical protein L9F63_011398, partial [Diploptera punctata]